MRVQWPGPELPTEGCSGGNDLSVRLSQRQEPCQSFGELSQRVLGWQVDFQGLLPAVVRFGGS